MKVVYIHQYFRTPDTGGGTRSYEFARRLVQNGHQVTIITGKLPGVGPRNRKKNGPWLEVKIDGINVFSCAIEYGNEMSFWRRVLAFCFFAGHASAKVFFLKADVVVATSTPLTVAIPAIFRRVGRGTPFVFEVRDLWPAIPIALGALRNGVLIRVAKTLESIAYRMSSKVIALSPGMKDGIVQAGIPPCKVSVIPNGCDLGVNVSVANLPPRLRQRLSDGKRYLVYAGTLGYVNNVDYLITIAEFLGESHPDISLVVVGDGAYRKRLISLASQRGILGRSIEVLSSMSKLELAPVLRSALAGVSTVIDVPALQANCANKVFDYMAAGIPVIVNHEGWIADVLREQRCGVVLPAVFDREATAIFNDWLAGDGRCGIPGANALRVARTRFNRDYLFEEFSAVLVNALKDNGSGQRKEKWERRKTR